MRDVLDRIGLMNPVPGEPPDSAWTASVLLDEIDARRRDTAMVGETATTPVRSPAPTRGARIALAAGAFATMLAVVGVAALITGDGRSKDVGAAHTLGLSQPGEVGPDQDVAEAFYRALIIGDRDAAQALTRGVVISGQDVEHLWEIEVVSIDCWDLTATLVSCTSIQTDAVTRQVSEAYGRQSSGFMTVIDGLVTHYTSDIQPDPVFDRYEAWLHTWGPFEWTALGCEPGSAVLVPGCIAIHIAEVERWLATGPDLSEITAAVERVSTAEAFVLAYVEGDLGPAHDPDDVNAVWGIEVVGVECEPAHVGAIVTCFATQIDDLSRQLSPDYAHRIMWRVSVDDGVVTVATVGLADPVFQQYESWLDATTPPGWLFHECSHGGWGAPVCTEVYLENLEAWLATDPDLSSIEG